jgi:cell division protein FtsA
VALIDIGGGTTDLAIFKDGIIRHTAVIPFGGNVITEDIKEGCSIIEKQAELLKVKFGSAWPGENKENEIVSIPGVRGREPKEISLKNLSKIINARVVEIIELVFAEIKAYGYDINRKKLIAGIVLTGGGSQLKHIKQLVEYITGLDTRIGYPNEHLAGNSGEAISSPLFATAVGLVMNSFETGSIGAVPFTEIEKEKEKAREIERENERARERELEMIRLNQMAEAQRIEEIKRKEQEAERVAKEALEEKEKVANSTETRIKKSFFDRYVEKFKDFLDNAE